jgi:hypothetical protein
MIVMSVDLDFLYLFSSMLHFPTNNIMINQFVCLDFVDIVIESTQGIYAKLKFYEYSFF